MLSIFVCVFFMYCNVPGSGSGILQCTLFAPLVCIFYLKNVHTVQLYFKRELQSSDVSSLFIMEFPSVLVVPIFSTLMVNGSYII